MLVRQGDVMLLQVENVPNDAVKVDVGERIVLAYGEVTGHHHSLLSKGVDLMEASGARYLIVGETTEVTHQEHNPVTIVPGIWRVAIQTHYTNVGNRRVMD